MYRSHKCTKIFTVRYFSTKIERGNETRSQSKTTQQVSPQTAFQDGNNDESSKLSRGRRLGSYIRLKDAYHHIKNK